jgi:diadenosine tetraphosphate (Ap4A) HIT family hydrolase
MEVKDSIAPVKSIMDIKPASRGHMLIVPKNISRISLKSPGMTYQQS